MVLGAAAPLTSSGVIAHQVCTDSTQVLITSALHGKTLSYGGRLGGEMNGINLPKKHGLFDLEEV